MAVHRRHRGCRRVGGSEEVVLSKDKERLALCINSFSTGAGGVSARLVDVGAGKDADYAAKDVKGAVVLGDQESGALWRRAVVTGGAVGVISTALPGYLNADPPGAATTTPRDQWDILQWNSIPFDEARKGFAFKASPRAAARLRRALAQDPGTEVHVTIESQFPTGPVRTLVAEIPGRSRSDERIVVAAHVQEPGANDNASGVATGAEMAAALSPPSATDGCPRPRARSRSSSSPRSAVAVSGSRRTPMPHRA